ncbi:MAG: sodium:solute symporter, partial [Bacteroidota bacterium]
IYKRLIKPDGTDKEYVRMSYIASVAVVVIGTIFGFFIGSLNDIIDWLVAALYGGFAAANLLKWYWWRFNSYGYFWGMVGGILAAMVLPKVLPDTVSSLEAFPLNLLLSLIGCFLGSLLTPADDMDTLVNFYRKTRPWGFWKPVLEELQKRHPEAQPNREFGRDAVNVIVGTIWQTSLTAAPIFMVIKQFDRMAIALGIALLTTIILKYNWYDKMEDYPQDISTDTDS